MPGSTVHPSNRSVGEKGKTLVGDDEVLQIREVEKHRVLSRGHVCRSPVLTDVHVRSIVIKKKNQDDTRPVKRLRRCTPYIEFKVCRRSIYTKYVCVRIYIKHFIRFI